MSAAGGDLVGRSGLGLALVVFTAVGLLEGVRLFARRAGAAGDGAARGGRRGARTDG
ncbi:hypothetical protein OG206_07075 [Streptomyces sp. NBC_01341]|uniref:hypothetical protein n=1 Tax=Streptomyces sp. NBC_01341 TaxID=2903831 RepID=UPI002E10F530|nr:hypothetical protein OG206_07075 [Streptomyces sp. NBC_01341]